FFLRALAAFTAFLVVDFAGQLADATVASADLLGGLAYAVAAPAGQALATRHRHRRGLCRRSAASRKGRLLFGDALLEGRDLGVRGRLGVARLLRGRLMGAGRDGNEQPRAGASQDLHRSSPAGRFNRARCTRRSIWMARSRASIAWRFSAF